MNPVLLKIIELGPAVMPLVEKVAQLGKDGIEYAKTFLDIKGLETDISNYYKEIDEIFKNIGKTIYDNKISINNITIKDDIERINVKVNDINNKKDEISRLENSIKRNEKLKDLPDIVQEIDKLQLEKEFKDLGKIIKKSQSKTKKKSK